MTLEEIRYTFDYSPDTGILTWRNPSKYTMRFKGCPVGCFSPYNYVVANIRGKTYYVHRIIWFYHYGTWPINEIDHANGIRTDNRIINLREATHAQNVHNRPLRKKGIWFDSRRGLWTSQIRINRKPLHLGEFVNKDEAENAYRVAHDQLRGKFSIFKRNAT